jgi:GNAT superfamily N-acetyltransferase
MEMEKEIPEKNLFMVCARLNRAALGDLPEKYHARRCGEHELDVWKAMPFDDPETAEGYHGFMTEYFDTVYGNRRADFFRKCLFVCDGQDMPVATCFLWKAYNKISTLHWFKVKKEHEGRGIGRALLSMILQGADKQDYPVYLHTHPSSCRAIKLYSDFGFSLITDPVIGQRTNDLEECLPILKAAMPEKYFRKLRTVKAPDDFLLAAGSSTVNEF